MQQGLKVQQVRAKWNFSLNTEHVFSLGARKGSVKNLAAWAPGANANTLNIPLEARGVGAALSPRGHGFRLARSSLFLEADQSIVCSLAGVRLAMEIVWFFGAFETYTGAKYCWVPKLRPLNKTYKKLRLIVWCYKNTFINLFWFCTESLIVSSNVPSSHLLLSPTM